MALKPPVPGLRRLRNASNDVAKVQVNIPAGDELEVSDVVAAQLAAASTAFNDAAVTPAGPAKKTPAKKAPAKADE